MREITDAVTVLIPTSTIPSHPSIDLIQKAILSVRETLALPSSPMIVCCDGAPAHEACERYTEYKGRLREFATLHNVQVTELETHAGLPGVLVEGFKHVHTPVALVFQHDCEVVRRVNVFEICRALSCNYLGINHIRLNHRVNRSIKSDSILKEV